MAQRPLIYVSYGMPKSGSTLAFELARAILELNGCPQKRLSAETIPTNQEGNFVGRLSQAQLERIEGEAAALGYPVVLKTHAAPTADVRAWIEAGRLQGHCVYRDPREIMLSAMDHGEKSRAEGLGAFARIDSFEDALKIIRKHVPQFLEWARCPGFLALYYDEVAFDTRATARRLCEQMALPADPAAVERRAKESFTQFNKGVRGRFREMPEAESRRVLDEFHDFYAGFIEPKGAPPPEPRREGFWDRLFRRT